MPALKNARHEKFCQARAVGVTVDLAYVEAGFKRNRGNASALNAKKNIQARIAEIQQPAVKRAESKIEASAEETLREAARLAYSDIRKLFDENGNLLQVHELDDDTARAVKKVKVTSRPGAKEGDDPIHVTEIEFWSKTDGIAKLGQHFKIFGEGETGKDPLQQFAELLFEAAGRPIPLAEPTTPALAEQSAAEPPKRRKSEPVEDARVVREEIAP